MKVVRFIGKWLILDGDSIGGSVKVRCFYSFNLTATKDPQSKHNLILTGFKTFLCGNASYQGATKGSIYLFVVQQQHH